MSSSNENDKPHEDISISSDSQKGSQKDKQPVKPVELDKISDKRIKGRKSDSSSDSQEVKKEIIPGIETIKQNLAIGLENSSKVTKQKQEELHKQALSIKDKYKKEFENGSKEAENVKNKLVANLNKQADKKAKKIDEITKKPENVLAIKMATNLIDQKVQETGLKKQFEEIKDSIESIKSETSDKIKDIKTKAVSILPQYNKKIEEEPYLYSLSQQQLIETRKKSHSILQSWDDKCQEYTQIHKTISEIIYNKLDRRIKISIESLSSILKYFQIKKDAEQQYLKIHYVKLPKISATYKDLSGAQTVSYPSMSSAFQEIDEMNDLMTKKILSFANFIEKSILKDKLTYDAVDYEQKTNLLKNSIKNQKLKVIKCQKSAERNQMKYNKLYHDLVVTEGKSKKGETDLYVIELKFKRRNQEYVTSQRELGLEVLKLWKETKKMELHRLQLIKDSFVQYLQKYQETYFKLPQMDNSLDYWEKFDPETEGNKNFDALNLLNVEEQTLLKKGLGIDDKRELSFSEVQFYLGDFSTEFLDRSSLLILRRFQVKRDTATMQAIFNVNCELVITSDDFLLFFDYQEEEELNQFLTPFKMTKLEKIEIKDKKEKSDELYIIEKTPGLIFESKNKILFKFYSFNQITEFKNYMTKMINMVNEQK